MQDRSLLSVIRFSVCDRHVHLGLVEQLLAEVRKGRVLVATEAAGQSLDGVISSPFSRVPKQNPDRTISVEGRFCHDCSTFLAAREVLSRLWRLGFFV